MKFKGTIIITDPCYIMPHSEIECPNHLDYMSDETYHKLPANFTKEENEQAQKYEAAMDAYWKKYKENDIWRNGSINIFKTGQGLEKFGFTNWLWGNTLYGDWSCTTFKLKEISKDKKPSEITQEDIEETLGEFCADAGLVGVFLLDEVLKFNPSFNYHTEKKWTTTLIEDFDGDIEYIIENDIAFIKGIGNINFITCQTGF